MTETRTAASPCPISGFDREEITRTWLAYNIIATYQDGSDPVTEDLPPETTQAEAERRVAFIWRVAPDLATLELTRVRRTEVTTEIVEDRREDFADQLAAGCFDHLLCA